MNTPCTQPIEDPGVPGACVNCGASVEWSEMRSGWGRKLFHTQAEVKRVKFEAEHYAAVLPDQENEFYAEYTHPTELGEDALAAVINIQSDDNGSAVVSMDDLTALLRSAGFILTRAAWLNDGNTSGVCDSCGHEATSHRVTRENDWCEGHWTCSCEGFVPGGATDTLGPQSDESQVHSTGEPKL